jgi:hypothetical protein
MRELLKFLWLPKGNGDFWPVLPVGFKRDGKFMSVNPTILVDTGADGTVLNLHLAGSFGFGPDDLEKETFSAVGGQTVLYSPKKAGLIEIQIGRSWFPLPSLKFGRAPVSLLGRDLIFSKFELRMTPTEFEFIPLPKRKS